MSAFQGSDGPKKNGPDARGDRDQGPGTLRIVELGATKALLRVKFCSFDDPGAIPCRSTNCCGIASALTANGALIIKGSSYRPASSQAPAAKNAKSAVITRSVISATLKACGRQSPKPSSNANYGNRRHGQPRCCQRGLRAAQSGGPKR
jgi:hypothetical protein